ncbi:DUF835 domain-containing protein [Pyrococcus sp. ST04]|uniref:DUF835 domain-containing protein n=1 Tax=Pyrococcus sp. ST04 TaxID=1183377 RepID=UPI0002605C9A|nr:DUF835 domain-containing protein [Pyrococcus sp. ST04]AFK22980.1 hypothetical protein Py04_1407 [Pyrococcus sp. ST04]
MKLMINIDIVLGVALLLLYVVLFYEHSRRGERPLLYYALAFLTLSIGALINSVTYLASISAFVSFFWIGTIEMTLPEFFNKYGNEIRYLTVVPVVAYLYFVQYSPFLVIFINMIVLMIAGVVTYFSNERELKTVSFLVFLLAFLTIGLYKYPSVIYKVQAIVALVLGYLIATSSLKIEIPVPLEKTESVNLKPGVMFMEKVPSNILEMALVFSRNPPREENKERWFWVTKVQRSEQTVEPTNLVKMLTLATRYMEKGGIVVLDCLEYLILENGFDSVLKFLAHLRDYAILYNSTVIIVGSMDSFSEREKTLILRVIGEEK